MSVPMSTASSRADLPLSPLAADTLGRLVAGLDQAGLWWLSGYAAGLASAGGAAAPVSTPTSAPVATDAPADAPRLTIVYGSQTGNAQREAERLGAAVDAAGLAVRIVRADAYTLQALKQERYLCLVVSTQGDGEPSDDARGLVALLSGRRSPRLERLHYSVFALGDSSYPQFCAIGRQLDARLAELGATRWRPLAEADLDIEAAAAPWRTDVLDRAREALKPSATVTPLRTPYASAGSTGAASDAAPFQAPLLSVQRITTHHAARDIRHVELSLEGSGLRYAPGDALGVRARNEDALVAAVLAHSGLDGDTEVAHDGTTRPLHDWLRAHRELTRLAPPLLRAQLERGGGPALAALLDPDASANLAAWMATRQVPDVLREHPAEWDAASLVAALRPLQPRLYSIASSQAVVGDEAHLAVAMVGGAPGTRGVASWFLAGRGEEADAPVYVEANPRFRLPADGHRDIVMIGAGTGVAPFRAFVQEREAAGARGHNWLFFGAPHFRTDFLYQLEWQRALKTGSLHRLDLAFSRDQAERIYVQHRLREHADALLGRLRDGAHLYVCGSIAMGRDVDEALVERVAQAAGGDREAAIETIAGWQAEGRYSRDVY